MNLTIKETAKNKITTSKLREVVKIAKNEKTGILFGINFKTIGKTLILF